MNNTFEIWTRVGENNCATVKYNADVSIESAYPAAGAVALPYKTNPSDESHRIITSLLIQHFDRPITFSIHFRIHISESLTTSSSSAIRFACVYFATCVVRIYYTCKQIRLVLTIGVDTSFTTENPRQNRDSIERVFGPLWPQPPFP